MTVIGEDQYFKSIYHKYMFALLYTDGTTRMKLLGISTYLYYSEIWAKQWMNRIYTCINSEENDDLQKANEKLLELYNSMIK